jgi:hypothetical protein
MKKNSTNNMDIQKYIILILCLIIMISSVNTIHLNDTYANYSDTEIIVPVFSASNDPSDYSPPFPPQNIHPTQGAKGQPTSILLQIQVVDPNNDDMEVSFYNADTNQLLDIQHQIKSGSMVSYEWTNLAYGYTYSWYATAEDHEGKTCSNTWKFTTNYQPNDPLLVSPENNSVNRNVSLILTVNVSDFDNIFLNVTFYDMNHQIIGECTNIQESASCQWLDLSYQTAYSWYVKISDGVSAVTSPLWTFTTREEYQKSSVHEIPGEDRSNSPPTAKTNGPYSANVSELIFFNASESYDTDGIIKSYHWDFGDGTNSTNKIVEKTYHDVKNYTVLLTVSDDDGASDTVYTYCSITGIIIKEITITPPLRRQNEMVSIDCVIHHSTPLVQVNLNMIGPDQTSSQIPMNRSSHLHNIYCLTQPYSTPGIYEFSIFAVDEKNRSTSSMEHSFSIYVPQPPIISDIRTHPISPSVGDFAIISAVLSSESTIISAFCTITLPNTEQSIVPMNYYATRDRYFVKIRCNFPGVYTFSIDATNSDNLSAQSLNHTFSAISDTSKPTISNILVNPSIQSIHEPVNITAIITDDSTVEGVTIHIISPDNQTMTFPMNKLTSSLYVYTSSFAIFGHYQFRISATDTSNNTNDTSLYFFDISDFKPPQITNISIDQHNDLMTITCNILDESIVTMASVIINHPDNTTSNSIMHQQNQNLYYTAHNLSTHGNYSYTIHAIDIFNNHQYSNVYTLTI